MILAQHKTNFSNLSMPEKSSLKKEIRKTILITGANQGIGFASACELASKGYNIVIACRSEIKAKEAVTQIQKQNELVTVEYLLVDFAELKSVKALNEEISKNNRYFDIVILNAGVLLPKIKETVDGFETSFQVNYLAQYLLIDNIIKKQQNKVPLKVITLTSVMYKLCGNLYRIKKDPVKWNQMFNENKDKQWRAYAMSKFATALLACNLNKMDGVQAIALHPGAVRTGMTEKINPKLRSKLQFLRKYLLKTETAAKHVVFCVENEVHPDQYRHVHKTCKLNSNVRKERNLFAIKKLSEELLQNYL